MSATPIPRTLALIIYGDLDISVLDELPKGRKPVQTYRIGESKRIRAYGFIAKQLDAGRQAFLICPLIEENEELQLASVNEYVKRWRRNIFQVIESDCCMENKSPPKSRMSWTILLPAGFRYWSPLQ